MICTVKDTITQKQFETALSVQDTSTVCCELGAKFSAFGRLPGSGWQFYTGSRTESPFALAVRGQSALLAGQADSEELDSFLRFLGVERIKTVEQPPLGWQQDTVMERFVLRAGHQLSVPECSSEMQLECTPSMGQVVDFLSSGEVFKNQPQEVLDCFYSEVCTMVNHGFAEIWAVRGPGGIPATAGAYAIYGGKAYLASVETAPEMRGQGIGGFLTCALSNKLAADGLEVELLSRPGYEPFYRKLGFVSDGSCGWYVPPLK